MARRMIDVAPLPLGKRRMVTAVPSAIARYPRIRFLSYVERTKEGSRAVDLSYDDYVKHRDARDGFCTKCGRWAPTSIDPEADGEPCPSCDGTVVGACLAAILFLSVEAS